MHANIYMHHISHNLPGDAYFDQISKNFAAYKNYLVKKNDKLRQSNIRKELKSPING